MKIIGVTIFSLRIPFVEAFSHSASVRACSDGIVVRVVGDDGTVGYGEGLPRPYVTGETVETCIHHMVHRLWPAIAGLNYPDLILGPDPVEVLAPVDITLPDHTQEGVIAWHAARAAVELALIDALLRRKDLSLAAILPPKRSEVTYSGVITTGSIATALRLTHACMQLGLQAIKIKIGGSDACRRVAAIREAVGPSVSLRVDANGAYAVPEAIATLNAMAPYSIDCAEQPVPRGDPADLAHVQAASPIPVMADESLVTAADVQELVEARACRLFNLRLSKCGGIRRTLEMASVAKRAGVRVQLGCQVGETAILSAAGRHVAAYIDDPVFVEGSYGGLLLAEDVGEEEVAFGHGGTAEVLRGPGLGVRVREDRLRAYAETVITLGAS
jgi:muconate cycloisomerase